MSYYRQWHGVLLRGCSDSCNQELLHKAYYLWTLTPNRHLLTLYLCLNSSLCDAFKYNLHGFTTIAFATIQSCVKTLLRIDQPGIDAQEMTKTIIPNRIYDPIAHTSSFVDFSMRTNTTNVYAADDVRPGGI